MSVERDVKLTTVGSGSDLHYLHAMSAVDLVFLYKAHLDLVEAIWGLCAESCWLAQARDLNAFQAGLKWESVVVPQLAGLLLKGNLLCGSKISLSPLKQRHG